MDDLLRKSSRRFVLQCGVIRLRDVERERFQIALVGLRAGKRGSARLMNLRDELGRRRKSTGAASAFRPMLVALPTEPIVPEPEPLPPLP